jgi:hypothetical protein
MSIVLDGTTGITTPDINTTAQSTDIISTGDISAVDATLSGGVYLGGTGAANYLDDYEEGTFTPTLNVGSATATGFYRKIGSMVHVNGAISSFSDTSTSSQIAITNLPFTSSSATNYSSSGGCGLYRYINHPYTQMAVYIGGNGTRLEFWSSNKTGGYTQVNHSHITDASAVIFYALTYATN